MGTRSGAAARILNQALAALAPCVLRGVLCAVLVMVWLVVSGAPAAVLATPSQGETQDQQVDRQEVVRVGFYECPFNIKDENGHLSGYAYDYQQDLASYTGWTYEYVEASWPVLLQMLEEGQIDLLSDVSYSEERAGKMLFSERSMGTEGYYLYVSSSDSSIDRDDLSTLSGKRVVANANSVQADLFVEWARANGVEATLVPGYGDGAMLEMLEKGEVDAIVAVDSYAFDNTVPLIKIGGSDFYFAVNKERPELKVQLDSAMGLLLDKNRYYNEDLYSQYLNNNASKTLPADDLAWLEGHGAIKVGYLDDYLAYCDEDENGRLTGALAEFLGMAEGALYNATLEFEPVSFGSLEELNAALQEGDVDCIFPAYFDRYVAEQSQTFVSKSVAGTSMIALARSGGFDESQPNSVALSAGESAVSLYIKEHYPNWTIVEAPSEDACIELVRKGQADCAVFSANRVDHVIQTSQYDGLVNVTLSHNTAVSFAVQRDNVHLLHILNQAIDAVPRSAIAGSLTYFATAPKTATFTDFVRDNALVVLTVILLLVTIFAVIGASYIRKTREAEKEVREALIAAEHANRAKTNFLNNMSHDIRTPMNAIIGFTSLAATHLDDKRLLEDYLKKIMTSSNHLLSLINDVLDMSRIESGKIKIEEQECQLSAVMHDLRNILQADVNAKRLNFLIDTVEVRDECVVCDKLRLSQAILNCMSNAIKFTMPGGTVGIRITQKGAPDKNGRARYEFAISDTGIGMGEDFVEHVFEPFTREESSTVSGIPGTGLGMAITKNIVDMMGGTISVKSQHGVGTEVTISLTFKVGEGTIAITTIKDLEGMRALVADDNMDTCASVTRMLETVGMVPEWTMSGKEAVYKARFACEGNRPYRAYIIDWLMPDMNGVEVVRQIRAVIGDDTPIIILTAYDWAEIEDEARSAGVTAFCAKPLFLSDLYGILNASIAAEPSRPARVEKRPDLGGKRVLLVEDNDLNREISASILMEMGVEVEEAENGRVAVEMVRRSLPGHYGMVLMDIQMPVMDGYEATRAIRSMDRPDALTLPIVAVSANAFEEDMLRSRQAGMDAHIAKPFNREKLEEVIARYLSR